MNEEKKSRNCFVICPIGNEGTDIRKRSDGVLNYIIAPALKQCGYENPVRADVMSEPGNITSHVIQQIIETDLVIADLTGHNPNVFYELAIRHAIKKPVIMIIRTGETIPFDIAQDRVIELDHRDLTSINKCIEVIIKQIRSIEKEPNKIDSPISTAIDIRLLGQSDNLQDKGLSKILEMLQDIRSTLSDRELLEEILKLLQDMGLRQEIFADIKTIKRFITRSKNFDSSEEDPSNAETLLLFHTSKQKTWLISTNERLYCILDDIRESEPYINWTIPKEDLVEGDKVTVKILAKDHTIDIGEEHQNWLYSKRLFNNIDVAASVRQFIERNMIKTGKAELM